MSKIRMRSSFSVKLIVLIVGIILLGLIIYFSFTIIGKKYKYLSYDVGKYDNDVVYSDVILTNYDEYKSLVHKYNIDNVLSSKMFENNNYLVSFQEYFPSEESKMKTVNKIEKNGDKLTITFNVHNKCGWGEKHLAIHLIQVNKNVKSNNIKYKYNYVKKLNCGNV